MEILIISIKKKIQWAKVGHACCSDHPMLQLILVDFEVKLGTKKEM